MNIIETFEKNGKTLEVYGTFDKPLFLAKQIGETLGFDCIRSVLRNMNPLWKDVHLMHTLGGVQQMTFLTEPGLYKLIMKSDKKEAVGFQEWVCEDVLPSIRKTGQYQIQHKYNKSLTFKIENEADLHTKTVSFIKKRFPTSIFVATLGELQDTSQKRIKAFQHGYLKGSPDIIINNLHKHYTGFVIEFKSPTGKGVVSDEQVKMIKQYKANGFKTMISNDYDDIIEQLIEYFKDIRIKCQFCTCKFKSQTTLENHHKYFHRIN